jgi:microcystin-dependent protein
MATISGLNTFTAGTPAQASQVNTNFSIIKTFAEGLSTGTNIDNGSIVSDKIANNTIVYDDLAVALQKFLVPVGTINAFAGTAAPTGWLLCNGAAFSAGTYPSLYAVLGNVASTPDMAGRFPMGKTASGTGSSLLGSGGSTTITTANMPSHTHTQNEHGHAATPTGSLGGAFSVFGIGPTVGGGQYSTFQVDYTQVNNVFSQNDLKPQNATAVNQSTGGGTAYNQPFLAVNYIIKHD